MSLGHRDRFVKRLVAPGDRGSIGIRSPQPGKRQGGRLVSREDMTDRSKETGLVAHDQHKSNLRAVRSENARVEFEI
jgi:hypothetical protein